MPKWLDLPPIWLIAMMALAYIIAGVLPMPGWPMPWLGGAAMVLGIGLAVWAALSFRAQKTSIIPHETPKNLITGGAFSYSRNPIYLADLIVLIGWCLIWGAALPFAVAPVFAWIITNRFIEPEEARLIDAFGDRFKTYKGTTRRWI